MPISPAVLQRRHAELGRIRLGDKASTSNGKTRPRKLEQFRFTSPSQGYINDLATIYGGTPQPWDNDGKAEFEVYTDAKSIPVIAVKGGLSQWMETWSGGGCVHRCDGEMNALTGGPCDPNDRAHQDAKPTTRLSVMLPELDAIGVWRMESHGWNAAAEIPAVAELAQYVGDLVPAELHLVERRAIKDGKTSRFVVPVLDLRIGQARLREIVAQKSGAELEAPSAAAALPAGQQQAPTGAPALAAPKAEVRMPTDAALAAMDEPKLKEVWDWATAQGVLDHEGLRDRLAARVAAVRAEAASAPGPTPAPVSMPDADGVVDAEVVESPAPMNADAVWQQILKVQGERGLTLDEITDDFSRVMGGLLADDASEAELSMYLARAAEQVSA